MVWRGFTHPWDPWEELNEVEDEMAHLFAGAYGAASHEFPPLNIWTNDEGAFVMAEVPGMSAGQLEVAVINDTLILRGSRLQEELPEGSHYHRRERGFGRFTRSIRLPFRVAQDRVEARVQDGMVRIHIPRAAGNRPHRIEVHEA